MLNTEPDQDEFVAVERGEASAVDERAYGAERGGDLAALGEL
jgi:hypothetical protein